MSCILCHWGVELRLADSWARPAILVAGKGRGGMLVDSRARPAILVAGKGRGGNVFVSSLSSLSFLFLFLPCPSLSSYQVLSLITVFTLSIGTP